MKLFNIFIKTKWAKVQGLTSLFTAFMVSQTTTVPRWMTERAFSINPPKA